MEQTENNASFFNLVLVFFWKLKSNYFQMKTLKFVQQQFWQIFERASKGRFNNVFYKYKLTF